ncbi:NuA4 histone H4 acetyltransferase complex and the SWR1 complex subunit [Blastocladiella emersonii ATCC 22665]|nr:NuA4 histone H4 acetyltransferase complex and the SWR1 complex subunit [Blastocladiella emersonii ATCC 22665]
MASRRKKGVQLILPIVYGNEASKLPDGAPEMEQGHTHRWRIYVCGPNGEDVSYFVKKVVIRLHESFVNAARVLEQPPFEVIETGWGEFETLISIHLHDFSEKPVKMAHMLRLFPPEGEPPVPADPARPGMLVTERFDEIIVNEPTEAFYETVVNNLGRSYPLAGPVWNRTTEADEIARLQSAIDTVQGQIKAYQDRIQQRDAELAAMKRESAMGLDGGHR